MNADYIQGSKDRARKIQPSAVRTSDYLRGYEAMHEILGPYEQKIVLAAFEYKAVAEQRIRELEEQFRDHGDAGDAAAPTAVPAFPSE